MQGDKAPAEMFFGILDSVPIGVIVIKSDFTIAFWNKTLERWTLSQRDAVVGRKLIELYPNLDKRQYIERLETIFSGGPTAIFSSLLHKSFIPVARKDGTSQIQHTIVTPITGPGGEPCAIVCIQDVTELNTRVASYKQMRDQAMNEVAERKRAEARLILASKVIENTQDGVMVTGPDHAIISVNRAFTEITGFDLEEVVGKTPGLLKSGKQEDSFYAQMWRALNETGAWSGEIWDRRKSGEIFAAWTRITAIQNEAGEVTHYVGIYTDHTERKLKEQKLEFLANHDPLTGLPNRMAFRDRLEMAIERASRFKTMVALMYIDLDRFKPVNDELGHNVGDAVLREVAHRLRSCLRKVDTVARLGGDEFVVIMQDVVEVENINATAVKILAEIEAPVMALGHVCNIGCSVGIALYPYDGGEADALIKRADECMYLAKEGGRGAYRFFSSAYPR
ncbi:MAG: diguanylate cyclase [Nitrospinae bacterium]|nr:diguanylate cyclase [Nitrospinota bacterium]